MFFMCFNAVGYMRENGKEETEPNLEKKKLKRRMRHLPVLLRDFFDEKKKNIKKCVVLKKKEKHWKWFEGKRNDEIFLR